MKRLAKRLTLELSDRLRYSPLVRGVMARAQLWRDSLSGGADPRAAARCIARLCSAARLAPDDRTMRRIEGRIFTRTRSLDLAALLWAELVPTASRSVVSKALIVKPWISDQEKGVVFVSFEDQWARLAAHCDLGAFARRYTLVVSPTWCPPHCLTNVLFPMVYPGPVYSLISNYRDMELFPRLSPKYRMVPLFASSWVNPGFYRPAPRDRRDLDIVMVANFGKYKRHHALFRALRQMPAPVKATLIGQSQDGRTADTIRREAWAYGVADRVTVLPSVSNETLADCLSRAKVSVITSRREGSCVAVVEALFADTPVVLLDDAQIGSAAFINEATGRLVPESGLAEGLSDLIARHADLSPRRWAEEHLSCFRSSHVLNEVLREAALKDGQEWTQDIAPLCWRPDPQLVHPEEAPWADAEWDWARRHLGVELGARPTPAAAPGPARALAVTGSGLPGASCPPCWS